MFRLVALLCFVAHGQAIAQPQHECSAIRLDSARLSCFDAAFPASEPEASSTADAFSQFRDLVSSERTADRGARQVYLDDCRLFDATFRGKASGDVFIDRRRMSLPEPKVISTSGDFWVLLLDLRQVDLSASRLREKSTEIVLRRGFEVRYVNVRMALRMFPGMKSYEDAVRVSDLQEAMVGSIFTMSRPDRWEFLASDPREVLYEFFKATNGEVGDTPHEFLMFEGQAKSARSLSWTFSTMWPEDAGKIHSAFMALAESCQT